MLVLRLYFILVFLTLAAALLMGWVRKDKRWFRFSWQLLKFSMVLLLVVGLAAVLGRIVLL